MVTRACYSAGTCHATQHNTRNGKNSQENPSKSKFTMFINLGLKSSADSLTAYVCFGITARQRKLLFKIDTVHSTGQAEIICYLDRLTKIKFSSP